MPRNGSIHRACPRCAIAACEAWVRSFEDRWKAVLSESAPCGEDYGNSTVAGIAKGALADLSDGIPQSIMDSFANTPDVTALVDALREARKVAIDFRDRGSVYAPTLQSLLDVLRCRVCNGQHVDLTNPGTPADDVVVARCYGCEGTGISSVEALLDAFDKAAPQPAEPDDYIPASADRPHGTIPVTLRYGGRGNPNFIDDDEQPAEPARELQLALLNCRMLAQREIRRWEGGDARKPSGVLTLAAWKHILRFCEEAGIVGSVLRADADAHVQASYAVCNSPGCLLKTGHQGDCIDSRPVEGGKP